ncbi:MAG TPA: hypothetical protein VNJ47_07100 [Nevskiales bacterium]|nr:hypothetical protein [Nevskiales bacterium]
MRRAFLALLVLLPLGLAVLWQARPPAASCDAPRLTVQARSLDARSQGYLLATSQAGHFRDAIYDLIQGRIRFFELPQADGRFHRYQLEDSRSAACLPRSALAASLDGLPLPAGRCLARRDVPQALSAYRVEEARDGLWRTLQLRARDSGAVLAVHRAPSRLARLLRTTDCPSKRPLWWLTGFVLPDRWGAVLTRTGLEAARAAGEPAPALLPAPDTVRWQLALEGEAPPEPCWLPGWAGPTEVHVIELEQGPLPVPARLDAESREAGMVLVDVHVPDAAVVILARAQGPTVWHVHESGRSSVVAMLVRGHHGQAVVGLSRFSRILMATRLHNPQARCSEAELREIEARVIAQYGVARRQRQDSRQQPPVPRYAVGEPMPEGGELFHYDRALSDFEVQDD